MRSLFNFLYKLFIHNPKNNNPTPWKSVQTRSGQIKNSVPEGLGYTPDRLIPNITTATDTGIETDLYWGSEKKRSPEVVALDRDIIEERRLNLDKYIDLKRHWAAGRTAYDLNKVYKGKKGYALSTLEKYWAAFNSTLSLRPNPSPTAKTG